MGEETSASWHSMSEDNIFSDHKVTLVLIKVKVCFLAIAKDWEIIHECSQFGQRKSPSYTSEVKLVRCKDQQHSPVGKCAERQVKVVLLGHTNLVMTRISVKVLEEWVFSQPFKNLVKEAERIVVISDSLVDYRYTSLMTSLWGVVSLLSKVSALFFGTTWTRLTKTPSYTR